MVRKKGSGGLKPGKSVGGVRVSNEGPVKNLRKTVYRSLIENILFRYRKKNPEISLAFVGDRTMRRLNRRYRGKDRPTDVLAFDLSPPVSYPEKGRRRVRDPKAGRGRLPSFPGSMNAEIVISSETARRQAAENGHSLHREISLLVIHGLLHALGYDHEKPGDARRMFRRERLLAREYLRPGRKRSRKNRGT